ncbi:hypothetical protein DIPPA_22164 [Diplonema papillatum]|nr:hypothetical protein DIPPA_22164 [Diplonema papillatum]
MGKLPWTSTFYLRPQYIRGIAGGYPQGKQASLDAVDPTRRGYAGRCAFVTVVVLLVLLGATGVVMLAAYYAADSEASHPCEGECIPSYCDSTETTTCMACAADGCCPQVVLRRSVYKASCTAAPNTLRGVGFAFLAIGLVLGGPGVLYLLAQRGRCEGGWRRFALFRAPAGSPAPKNPFDDLVVRNEPVTAVVDGNGSVGFVHDPVVADSHAVGMVYSPSHAATWCEGWGSGGDSADGTDSVASTTPAPPPVSVGRAPQGGSASPQAGGPALQGRALRTPAMTPEAHWDRVVPSPVAPPAAAQRPLSNEHTPVPVRRRRVRNVTTGTCPFDSPPGSSGGEATEPSVSPKAAGRAADKFASPPSSVASVATCSPDTRPAGGGESRSRSRSNSGSKHKSENRSESRSGSPSGSEARSWKSGSSGRGKRRRGTGGGEGSAYDPDLLPIDAGPIELVAME